MERITISLRSELAEQFDEFIQKKGYSNRSEAMRDLIRDRLEAERLQAQDDGFCIGILSYVYDIEEYDLPSRLAKALNEFHDICVSSHQTHLDHNNRLESVVLRGASRRVRSFADSLIAERGVRHGRLQVVPLELAEVQQEQLLQHLHLHPIT
jgi:CopG family nickel-responsive transcriptional regulator